MAINMSTLKTLPFGEMKGGYSKLYSVDKESIPTILNASTVHNCDTELYGDTIDGIYIKSHDPLINLIGSDDPDFEPGIIGVLYSSNNTFDQNILCCTIYWIMNPIVFNTKNDWLTSHWNKFKQFHNHTPEEIEDLMDKVATPKLRHTLAMTLARAMEELLLHK